MSRQFPTDTRQVARSQNEDGSWNFSRVDVSEITLGVLGSSHTSIVVGLGTHILLLVEDFGTLLSGAFVQISSVEDPRVYMSGQVVSTSSNAEGGLEFTVVVDTVSSIGVGETINFWEITGSSFNNFSPEFTVDGPTAVATGTTVDISIPDTINELVVLFNNISINTDNADLRIQALTAAATPDTTANNYKYFGIYDSGTPVVFQNINATNIASFIYTTGTSDKSHTISGHIRLTGMAANVGGSVAFDSAWCSSGTALERGMATGVWINASSLYGIRMTRTSGNFDGSGTVTILYR